jgi:hypothetical protein
MEGLLRDARSDWSFSKGCGKYLNPYSPALILLPTYWDGTLC